MTASVTDKTLRAWLHVVPVDRSIGDGLIFLATTASASKGRASWVLRYRFNGTEREQVLGRYLFLARKRIRMKGGVARRDRFGHVSSDTLNVALRRLPLDGVAHFAVHDIRRTAHSHGGARRGSLCCRTGHALP